MNLEPSIRGICSADSEMWEGLALQKVISMYLLNKLTTVEVGLILISYRLENITVD